MDRAEKYIDSLKISEGVISSVVRYAVCDVDGVAGLYGKSGSAENKRSVRLSLDADFPEVSVRVMVTPNCRTVTVCENIQKRVRENVLAMTGIALGRVNVMVEGIAQISG